MWGALFRQLAIFLFTRRGKRIAALIGLVLLGFVTALLLDSRMYLSAAFSGLMTVAALFAFVVQSVKQRGAERQRIRRAAEQEIQRTAAAQARAEKRGKAKSRVASAAKAARGTASSMARLARTGVAASRNRINKWRRKEQD
jgi:hypothetical protein